MISPTKPACFEILRQNPVGSLKMNTVEAKLSGIGEFALLGALGPQFPLSLTNLREGDIATGPSEIGIRPGDLH
jgi:hypothetical protein